MAKGQGGAAKRERIRRDKRLSDAALRRTWSGRDEWISDKGSRGAGRLIAKLAQSGITFYFTYFDGRGKRRFLPIAPYDSTGRRGKTLAQARDKAHEWSELFRSGVADLHGHLAELEAQRQRERKQAAAAALIEEEAAKRSSLRQLLDAYTGHLERMGKLSAGDVKRIFERHVYQAAPILTERKAADIPVDEFVPLLAKLTEAGKGRTAAKLRSYLRAAYSLALSAKTDPDAPMSLRAFGITSNPLASIAALSKYNRARDRNLSAEELGAFMAHLEKIAGGVQRDALWVSLLLGGQRPTQLLRARPIDLDLSAETLTLYDPKGKRKQPRAHVLPLTTKAAAIFKHITKNLPAKSEYLFTSDGKRALRVETVSSVVVGIVDEMVKGKQARERFQLRDIRRTCETMLAALKVSSDVRAQLQSHGLGGVQQRHYDRHSYMTEKRAALTKWEKYLARIASTESAQIITPDFKTRERARH